MKSKLNNFIKLFSRGNFKVRYAVALIIIAVLSTFLQVVVQLNLENQKTGLTHIQTMRAHLSEVEGIRKKLFAIQTITDDLKFYLQLEGTALQLAETLQLETEVSIDHTEVTTLLQKISSFNIKTDRTEVATILFELNAQLVRYNEMGSDQLEKEDKKLTSQLDRFRLIELSILVLTLLVLVAEDLFIFRPAIKKLESALQDRSDFFSRIGHEIRNPMNSILGTVELLSDTHLNSTQRNYLSRLKKSAQGLLNFLNNMIEYSSIENKHATLNVDEVDTQELISEITSLFSLDTYRKGLDFFVYTDLLPLTIKTDSIKVRHIILNLLGNAIKFTEKGSIFFSLTFIEENKELIIRVRDTGIGIPADKKDLIFNAFTQADSSVKRKHGGTGLGLTIAREYLDVLGGSIAVNSSPGEGSEFVVTLPLIDYKGSIYPTLPHYNQIYVIGSDDLLKWTLAHKHKNSEVLHIEQGQIPHYGNNNSAIIVDRRVDISKIKEPSLELLYVGLEIDKIPTAHFKEIISLYPLMSWNIGDEELATDETLQNLDPKSRVLVCDDAKENRFILKAFLQKFFQNIDEASGGEECIQLCQKTNYDIVLLDIQMPDIDGYSVIEKLKSMSHYQKRSRIIACTAHNSDIEKDKIKASGFQAHLIKPIAMQSLLEALSAQSLPSLEDRLQTRIKSQRPLYLKTKLEELALLETQTTIGISDFKVFGHKLKGSASSYGFDELSKLGSELEDSANLRDHMACQKLLADIKAALNKENV